ncbi:methyl-CpG-binding domain protein 3 isoform X4 [Loxodonta africana]|uniref:methyl-CpG-binding domain protein 3 isoform X4 n=1 Tax=Loxodonta africana TaxID=9785 RepID=UPI0030D48740
MERKRWECPALPQGWEREEVPRRSGLSAGHRDVFYYSPSGKKFRSKPQLARYLGGSMDLSTFDFRTGRMLMSKVNKSRQRMRYDSSTQVKGKPDLNTALPVRQTASIFKQPVTKITNHPSNKVKSDPQKAVDQPRQLFWEKKLSGLNAFDIAEELVKTMDLPKGLQGVGPGCTDETLLSAIASALHTSTMPITGQLSAAVEKNPGVWLNTTQPLCKAFMVTDEDISYRLSWETVLRPTPVGQSRQRHRGSLSLWPTLSPGMEPLGADTGDVSNTSSLRRNPEERPAECFPLGFASW